MRAFLIALVILAAPAAAQASPWLGIDGAGDPTSWPPQYRWTVCEPEQPCGSSFVGGALPAGTTVTATVNGTTVRQATWHGTVTSLTPPVLSGTAMTYGVVSAQAGTWSGGWGDEVDLVGVIACPDAPGVGRCRTLTTRHGMAPGTYKVDADLVGYKLYAADARVAHDFVGPRPPVRQFATPTSYSPASAPLAAPPPVVTLRQTVARFADGYSFGRAQCFTTCSIVLQVLRGTRHWSVTNQVAHGIVSLRIPAVDLRSGRYRAAVTIDGRRIATGFVRV